MTPGPPSEEQVGLAVEFADLSFARGRIFAQLVALDRFGDLIDSHSELAILAEGLSVSGLRERLAATDDRLRAIWSALGAKEDLNGVYKELQEVRDVHWSGSAAERRTAPPSIGDTVAEVRSLLMAAMGPEAEASRESAVAVVIQAAGIAGEVTDLLLYRARQAARDESAARMALTPFGMGPYDGKGLRHQTSTLDDARKRKDSVWKEWRERGNTSGDVV